MLKIIIFKERVGDGIYGILNNISDEFNHWVENNNPEIVSINSSSVSHQVNNRHFVITILTVLYKMP